MIEILSNDELNVIENLENGIEKLVDTIPSIDELTTNNTKYELLEFCFVRQNLRQAAPEKMLLCHIIHDTHTELALFWYHAQNKKKMDFNDFKNYLEQYKINFDTDVVPEKLTKIAELLSMYKEKLKLEAQVNPNDVNKNKLKI